jgi:hypothetical protein
MSEIFVINIGAVISNLYVVTVNKMYVCTFSRHYSFFRVPLNILVRTPVLRVPQVRNR